MPVLATKCMDSWQRYFPGWEIRLWNESNSPMQNNYLQKAFANKKWSNMTNFMRLYALQNFGGIYFDTDVEVIRPFDFLPGHSCFVGFENSRDDGAMSINNAVIGATINHPFVAESYERLLQQFDGLEESYLSGPGLTTALLKEKGLTKNEAQEIAGVHIFSREAFHPFDWDDVFTYSSVKAGTYTIHYWDLSWKDAATELKQLHAEKQKLVQQLKQTQAALADFSEGKIKGKDLLKTNFRFLKHSWDNKK
jgi:mannosyltransferase OCH1-like enzyme